MKNIMVQICAKMGGIPWGFKKLPLMDVPTMLVGIDVCHHVGKYKDSILGFTATMDRYIGRYYIDSVKVANPDNKKKPSEILFKLEDLFQKAILRFKEENGITPKRIIVYRDAVSEGQIELTRR